LGDRADANGLRGGERDRVVPPQLRPGSIKAIMFVVGTHANTLPVTFESDGSQLSGTLFIPPEHTPGTRVPGIIVTGSWTTVKEQMAGLYALRLAQRGFVTLAFDFRHWGASEGHPRQYESPERKIRDIANAAAYLQSRHEVAGESIGALAICASAGYVAHAVARGAPLRSVALVASWLHDKATVSTVYGGDLGIDRRLEAARAARKQFERTGTPTYVAAYDPHDPEAAMFFPLDYYAQSDRGAVPEWTNRFAVMSWDEWLTFDAIAAARAMSVPTLMVHADGAALPDNARRFFATIPGVKHLFWTVGTQTDFYDREPQVGLAVDVAVAHFRRTLGPPAGAGTLADRQAISDTITGLLHAIDRRDWTAVRSRLADQVRTDYTSLFGGSIRIQSAAELIESWRALVPGFEATQHLTGPIVADIAGDRARARCAVTAIHRIGRDHWTPSGHYEMELVRASNAWTIGAITYHKVCVVGDETLPEKAQARVASVT
jgi:fermentation-respiration switch protein FrsA (DUF1100 family)